MIEIGIIKNEFSPGLPAEGVAPWRNINYSHRISPGYPAGLHRAMEGCKLFASSGS